MLFRVLACVFLAGSLAACHPYKKEVPTGHALKLDNVYTNPAYDHSTLTNVLLLPIGNPQSDENIEDRRQDMALSLMRNIAKFHYFHLHYDRDYPEYGDPLVDLETDTLDRVKIGALAKEKNVDAVLKVSVTEYRPFFPMLLKLKVLLVDAETGEKLWALDQVFDADDANVINGMRYWWNAHRAGGESTNRFNLSVLRPSFFMNYVFYSVAETYSQSRIENLKSIQERYKMEVEKRESMKEIQKLSFNEE